MPTKKKKIKLKRYIGVLNTKDTSLEITVFFEEDRDGEYILQKIESILTRLYSKLMLSTLGTSYNPKVTESMVGIGANSDVIKLNRDESNNVLNMVHYELFRGHCLDEKKLSYFNPIKTISSGEISIDEIEGVT